MNNSSFDFSQRGEMLIKPYVLLSREVRKKIQHLGGIELFSARFELMREESLFLVQPDGVITWDSVGFVRIDLEDLSRRLDIPIFHNGDIVPAAKAG